MESLRPKRRQYCAWRFWVFLVFFKIIGLATLTIELSNDRRRDSPDYRFVGSTLGVTYNLFLVGLAIGSAFVSLPYTYYSDYLNKNVITNGIELMQTILGCLLANVVFLNHCYYQERMVQLCNRFSRIDRMIDAKNSKSVNRWNQIIPYFGYINLIIFVLLWITETFAFEITPAAWLTDLIPTFIVGWHFIQYFITSTLIFTRISLVNNGIQELSHVCWPEIGVTSIYRIRPTKGIGSVLEQLTQLRNAYSHLCESCLEAAEFFGPPTLICLTFTFLTIIYNMYYILAPFVVEVKELETIFVLNTILWLLALAYPLILVTTKNTRVMNEFERTGVIVHDLSKVTTADRLLSELKQFSLQLLHRKTDFSACGFFNVDCTLLQMIIGAVTTYLVILIQFQISFEAKAARKIACNCTD